MQTKKSSNVIFKGRIFDLTEDEVIIEDQSVVKRSVIHHDGGVAILVVKDHKILLVSQYRYAVGAQTLELPAGKIEKGEDPAVCGMRELEEEAGFCADQLELITAMYSTPGFCNEVIYIYEAVGLHKVEHPRPMDDDEFIDVVWLDLEDAYQQVLNGSIKDAKTIIAIQYAYINARKEETK